MEDLIIGYLKDSQFLHGMIALWVVSVILQAMPNPGPDANIWLRWLYAIAQGFGSNVSHILNVFNLRKKQ